MSSQKYESNIPVPSRRISESSKMADEMKVGQSIVLCYDKANRLATAIRRAGYKAVTRKLNHHDYADIDSPTRVWKFNKGGDK